MKIANENYEDESVSSRHLYAAIGYLASIHKSLLSGIENGKMNPISSF